jgi:hypothetical protein
MSISATLACSTRRQFKGSGDKLFSNIHVQYFSQQFFLFLQDTSDVTADTLQEEKQGVSGLFWVCKNS